MRLFIWCEDWTLAFQYKNHIKLWFSLSDKFFIHSVLISYSLYSFLWNLSYSKILCWQIYAQCFIEFFWSAHFCMSIVKFLLSYEAQVMIIFQRLQKNQIYSSILSRSCLHYNNKMSDWFDLQNVHAFDICHASDKLMTCDWSDDIDYLKKTSI